MADEPGCSRKAALLWRGLCCGLASSTSVSPLRCPGTAGDPGAAGATLLKALAGFRVYIHNGSLLQALSSPLDHVS